MFFSLSSAQGMEGAAGRVAQESRDKIRTALQPPRLRLNASHPYRVATGAIDEHDTPQGRER
jgi:hypothetical protein